MVATLVSSGTAVLCLLASIGSALAFSPVTSWSERPLPFSFTPLQLQSDSAAVASSESTRTRGTAHNVILPRAAFLLSIAAFGGTPFLFGSLPATAATAITIVPSQDNPAAKFQAGLENLDRAVTKEAKKVDRTVTKERKKITKTIKIETKKIDNKTQKVTKDIKKEVKKIDKKTQKATKGIKKETKKVLRDVDKETEKIKQKATEIKNVVEKKTNALVGGAVPQSSSSGGIDVSKLKVCDDSKKKCVR